VTLQLKNKEIGGKNKRNFFLKSLSLSDNGDNISKYNKNNISESSDEISEPDIIIPKNNQKIINRNSANTNFIVKKLMDQSLLHKKTNRIKYDRSTDSEIEEDKTFIPVKKYKCINKQEKNTQSNNNFAK
jgi:hypothetical protein